MLEEGIGSTKVVNERSMNYTTVILEMVMIGVKIIQ